MKPAPLPVAIPRQSPAVVADALGSQAASTYVPADEALKVATCAVAPPWVAAASRESAGVVRERVASVVPGGYRSNSTSAAAGGTVSSSWSFAFNATVQ